MMRELTSSVSQGARLVLNVQVARTLLASCSSKETHTTTDFNHPPRSAGNEVSTWRCTLTNVCSPVWLLAPRRESQQRSGHARTSRGGIAASRARRNGTGRMPPSAHEASGLEDGVAREGQANTARATGERNNIFIACERWLPTVAGLLGGRQRVRPLAFKGRQRKLNGLPL